MKMLTELGLVGEARQRSNISKPCRKKVQKPFKTSLEISFSPYVLRVRAAKSVSVAVKEPHHPLVFLLSSLPSSITASTSVSSPVTSGGRMSKGNESLHHPSCLDREGREVLQSQVKKRKLSDPSLPEPLPPAILFDPMNSLRDIEFGGDVNLLRHRGSQRIQAINTTDPLSVFT